MERIIDISSDGLHISVYRGFLMITKNKEELGRIALTDIGGVIAHAHGLTWSNNALVRLSEQNVPVVICAANHMPVSCLWPLEGHHLQGQRIKSQIKTKSPLIKQAWKQIIQTKIRFQGAVLSSIGQNAEPFDLLSRKVRSGDPENIEAQAARRYWPLLMGPHFKRDQSGDGCNALLNYGYTILRAMVSRAICGSGLHPSIGLHHSNQFNAFALADDLMEPYRPLVDRAVYNLLQDGEDEVSSHAKIALPSLTTFDVQTDMGTSPLFLQISRHTHSLATSFINEKLSLSTLQLPTALQLASLGRSLS